MNRRQLLTLLLSGCAALLGAASAQESRIITVEAASAFNTATVSGTVIPFKEVTLTAQLPGRVKMIAGEEGDYFPQGTVLVEIDDAALRAKRKQVEAQIANASAALRNAQVQYSRELISPRSESPASMPGFGLPIMMDNVFTKNMSQFMGMSEPGLERHADLYSAWTGINQAQSQLLQAQSALQEIDTKIRDAKSIAPFDGVILKKMVEVGDTVQPGQPLIVFGHIKYLRIQAEVPARLVSGLRKGMLVPVRLDNGVHTKARVAQIYPMADPTRHTVTVKFDLPKGVNASPGMYAELKLPEPSVGGAQKAVIPVSALIKGRSLPAVLVVTDDGSTSIRLVRLGERIGKDRVVVLSGVKPGMRIVDNPPPNAHSGWTPGNMAR